MALLKLYTELLSSSHEGVYWAFYTLLPPVATLKSSPDIQLQVRRVESFGTLVCVTAGARTPKPDHTLFLLGRSEHDSGLSVIAGHWMFPHLVKSLGAFQLISPKECQAELRRHEKTKVETEVQENMSQALQLLKNAGIELNKKQALKLTASVRESLANPSKGT